MGVLTKKIGGKRGAKNGKGKKTVTLVAKKKWVAGYRKMPGGAGTTTYI